MENKNNTFDNTVESLFKGMESFITSKTVVGDAITVGDTIILPLIDVSFGVGAGAEVMSISYVPPSSKMRLVSILSHKTFSILPLTYKTTFLGQFAASN